MGSAQSTAGGIGGGNKSINSDQQKSNNSKRDTDEFPVPTGHEYDKIDELAAALPHVIDEESRIQVEDYKQACNNGKGPMVACFATAEFISLYERKHKEAAELYRNVCFRPASDKSPNGVLIDGTKAYAAGCYNLAKMLITGKGGIQYDRKEAYELLDRACRTDAHGGACYLQAQMLCSPKDSLGVGIPHNPQKAIELYQKNCDDGDAICCFSLATMLLRGDKVTKTADNVSPQEARGMAPLVKRENEKDRAFRGEDEPYVIPRDPKRAEQLLKKACDTGTHVTSCHNLAVMYTHGDDNVPVDPEKAEYYRKKTEEKIHLFGGFEIGGSR